MLAFIMQLSLTSRSARDSALGFVLCDVERRWIDISVGGTHVAYCFCAVNNSKHGNGRSECTRMCMWGCNLAESAKQESGAVPLAGSSADQPQFALFPKLWAVQGSLKKRFHFLPRAWRQPGCTISLKRPQLC